MSVKNTAIISEYGSVTNLKRTCSEKTNKRIRLEKWLKRFYRIFRTFVYSCSSCLLASLSFNNDVQFTYVHSCCHIRFIILVINKFSVARIITYGDEFTRRMEFTFIFKCRRPSKSLTTI